MSRVIWKYTLRTPGSGFDIQEPGVIRHVAWQMGHPTIWAEIDPDDPRGMRYRRFEVIATGQRFNPTGLQMIFHGTTHDPDEGHVWHIYELVQP